MIRCASVSRLTSLWGCFWSVRLLIVCVSRLWSHSFIWNEVSSLHVCTLSYQGVWCIGELKYTTIMMICGCFVQLCQLANTLIVPPESLLEVVDSSLQMDRATARKYVALREDYQTAKVDGKSLATLLGEPALRGVTASS
jgi:hypothetical protein